MCSNQLVIETPDGWMIRCAACQWHEFPKKPLGNGCIWTFNGDMFKPTFTPSMNQGSNQPGPHYNPDCPSSRCHFNVDDGMITYHNDCSHSLRGKMDMLPWPQERVDYYALLKKADGW